MRRDVSEIEGIGPVRASQLAAKGVETLTDLLEYGIRRGERKLYLEDREKDWFNQALLFLIGDLDKDDVEVLGRNRLTIGRIDRLLVQTIIKHFEVAKEAKLTKSIPSAERILKWQLEAARVSQAPLIIFAIDVEGPDRAFDDFSLRINGKTHSFDAKGKAVIAGVAGWALVGKLYCQGRLIDFINFPGNHQFSTLKKTYTQAVLLPSTSCVLATPTIVANNTMHLEFVSELKSDFSNGESFWGKRSTGSKGHLLLDRYQVCGRSLVFRTMSDAEIDIEHDQAYVLDGGKVSRKGV